MTYSYRLYGRKFTEWTSHGDARQNAKGMNNHEHIHGSSLLVWFGFNILWIKSTKCGLFFQISDLKNYIHGSGRTLNNSIKIRIFIHIPHPTYWNDFTATFPYLVTDPSTLDIQPEINTPQENTSIKRKLSSN